MIKKLMSFLVVFSWVWLSLILSLGIAWHALAKVDFGYVLWYEHGGIKETIDEFAPQNKHKQDFALAGKQQHLAAFGAIVDSIQNHGQGLDKISYQVNGTTHQLLHNAEIIHLQDVANLIDWLNKFLIYAFIIWLIILIYRLKISAPFSKKQAFWSIFTGFSLILLPIIIFGPTKVFYQLHIWVFPKDNQWFFYYQDSLMSTMMKAPDLFGFIALSLLLTTLIIYTVALIILKKLYKKPSINLH